MDQIKEKIVKFFEEDTPFPIVLYHPSPVEKTTFITNYLPENFNIECFHWFDASAVDGDPLTIEIFFKFLLEDWGLVRKYDISKPDEDNHLDKATDLLLEFLKVWKKPILLVLANAGPYEHFSKFFEFLSTKESSLLRIVIITKCGPNNSSDHCTSTKGVELNKDLFVEIETFENRLETLKFSDEIQMQRDFLLEVVAFFKKVSEHDNDSSIQLQYRSFRIIQDITHELGEREIYLKLWGKYSTKLSKLRVFAKKLYTNLVIYGTWVYGMEPDENSKKIRILENALEIVKGSKEVAYALYHLGNAYGRRKDHKTRIKLLEKSLEKVKEVYGEGHLELLRTYLSLGNAYKELCLPKTAKEYILKAIEIQGNHYGEDHHSIPYSLYSLSRVYNRTGEQVEKLQTFQKIHRIILKKFGPDHFSLSEVIIRMGWTHTQLGNTEMVLEKEALQILENYFGEENHFMIYIIRNWGFWPDRVFSFKKTEVFYEKILKFEKECYGLERINTVNGLAKMYAWLNEHEKMMDLHSKVISISNQEFGNVMNNFIALNHNAKAYSILGDYTKELELLNRGLTILEEQYGAIHSIVHVQQLAQVALVYANLEDLTTAKILTEQILEIMTDCYKEDNYNFISILLLLSPIYEKRNAHGDMGALKDKAKLLERACGINEKHFGPDSLEFGKSLIAVSSVYLTMKECPQKRIDCLEKVLKIQQKHYPENHPEIGFTTYSLGKAHGCNGRNPEARKYLERCLEIREIHYEPNDILIRKTLESLAVVYGKLHLYEKKREVLEKLAYSS